MEHKLNELAKGNKINVYDKKLIEVLSKKLGVALVAKQEESKFVVWKASERELTNHFKGWCVENGFKQNDAKVLEYYLKGVSVIWIRT